MFDPLVVLNSPNGQIEAANLHYLSVPIWITLRNSWKVISINISETLTHCGARWFDKSEHNIGQIEVSTLFYLFAIFTNHRYIKKLEYGEKGSFFCNLFKKKKISYSYSIDIDIV